MLKLDDSNSFIANWNESNRHLNPCRGGFLEKTIRKAINIILFIPDSLVAACINPRKEALFYPYSEINKNHGDFAKEIITPDQVHLAANIHITEDATPDTPTVILFNPLGANQFVHSGLKAKLIAQKCNVVSFDYRGYGTTRKAGSLVIDGDSIYQYVTNELGTNKNKVHFFGFSLGGAIAAQVKALHPDSEGKYVGDRPFKSVFSLITENLCIEKYGRIIKKITSVVSAILIAFPLYLLGWEWDGAKALSGLKGDMHLIYHPNDILVPIEASLASVGSNEQKISLDSKETGPSTHFSPLANKKTAEGADAGDLIAEFLSK